MTIFYSESLTVEISQNQTESRIIWNKVCDVYSPGSLLLITFSLSYLGPFVFTRTFSSSSNSTAAKETMYGLSTWASCSCSPIHQSPYRWIAGHADVTTGLWFKEAWNHEFRWSILRRSHIQWVRFRESFITHLLTVTEYSKLAVHLWQIISKRLTAENSRWWC